MGIPSVITTDQGREFRNQLNKQLTDGFGIKHHLTTSYQPHVYNQNVLIYITYYMTLYNQTIVNVISKYA